MDACQKCEEGELHEVDPADGCARFVCLSCDAPHIEIDEAVVLECTKCNEPACLADEDGDEYPMCLELCCDHYVSWRSESQRAKYEHEQGLRESAGDHARDMRKDGASNGDL